VSTTYVAGPEDVGARVDVVIARRAAASRAAVAAAFAAGAVTRNGVPVKRSAALDDGDVLVYAIAETAALIATPQAIPLEVPYEDDELLVVVKPWGMVTHPSLGSPDGTLANALLAHVGFLPGDAVRPGLVHRLDRDTSGLLVVAKTETALRALGKAMMARRIERTYLGLVVGVPSSPKGTLDGPIARDPQHRLRRTVLRDGKHAVTHYAVREAFANASELAFRLETGRTHQIRVHLAAFGHPIMNDPLYGRSDPRIPLPGQALHAWRLAFRHPITGEPLAFEAEPSAEYVRGRDALRGTQAPIGA